MPDSANIENLNITVSASSDKASASLDKLVGSLNKAADANKDLAQSTKKTASEAKESKKATEEAKDKLDATAASVGKLAKMLNSMGLSSIAKQMRTMQKDVDLSQNLDKTSKKISEVSGQFKKLKGYENVSAALGSIAEDPVAANTALEDAVEKQKKAAQALKEQEKAAKEQAKALEKAAKEAERIAQAQKRKEAKTEQDTYAQYMQQQANEARLELAKQAAEAKALAKQEEQAKREAAKAAREQAKEEARLTKELEKQKSAVSKTKEAFKRFLGSIGRIAMYRAIRSAIKAITSALKEGLTNLKTYSEEVGTAFAPAVDNLKQHIMLLKNSIATALRPVIEALIPIVIQLADAFSKAADFIAQVMSVITGKVDDQGRYTKAVLGDLEQSNKEAKELKRTLLGFDEINRLNGDTGSGESSAASTQFVQADVGEGAKSVAEFLKGVDWKTILDVAVAVAPVLLLIKGAGFIGNITKMASGLKSAASALGSFVTAHPILAAILAVITAMAIWGDKIAEAMEKAKEKVNDFFNKVKVEDSSTAAGLQFMRDLINIILEIVGTLSSMIYKLFHADFAGALVDLIHLVAVVFKGGLTLLVDFVNIILGFVSDIVNAVLKAAQWVWNNALQPVFNWVAKAFKNAYIWLHNAWIDIRLGINAGIIWILEKVNDLLHGVEVAINGIIEVINWLFGENIEPVNLQIDTSSLKETREMLKEQKWDPIKEDLDIVPKWDGELEPLKFQLDASDAYKMIDDAERYLTNKVKNMTNEVNKLSAATSQLYNDNAAQRAIRDRTPQMIQLYASGGYPSAGSMFIAGESGPELVANVGSTTGVWNTDQLVQGMYSAMSAALAANPSGGDIYLDGELIYRNVVRRNNNNVRATGRSALLT